MDDSPISTAGEELPLPPSRLLERLSQIPGYTWDHTLGPFHTTYDHWHVLGFKNTFDQDHSHTPSRSTTGTSIRSGSSRGSPKLDGRPSMRHHWSSISESDSEVSSTRLDPEAMWLPVVARVSNQSLKLEREFNYNLQVIKSFDPECKHTVRPIQMVRLPGSAGDKTPLLVGIYERPGDNYLRDLVSFGPAFYGYRARLNSGAAASGAIEQVPLQLFLDFAVGACECLEFLHHGAKYVHGELRPDAFHYNKELNVVKLLTGGNGPRSFENLLSSEGWSSVSKELGVKNKLQYIAPEQTGRLASEPDSRTDIYSLGVIFWCLLTGQTAFDAELPIDIVQKVLREKLPPVSSRRMDVPDVISHIINKMTQKQMDERYHSVNGLKYDLLQISKFLEEGDEQKIRDYQIGLKDVSAFFILPSKTVGRDGEVEKITKIIDRSHKNQVSLERKAHAHALYNISSNSSVSEARFDGGGIEYVDGSSDSSSTNVRESRRDSNAAQILTSPVTHVEKHSLFSPQGRIVSDLRSNSWETASDRDSNQSNEFSSFGQFNTMASLSRRKGQAKFRRKGRTEIISIIGPQGVGKSHLIKTIQPLARRRGYFALARFDRARPTPFEPLLKVMSSIFRQIFSEKDVSTAYHEMIRAAVKPIWHILHGVLDLPETLLNFTPLRQRPEGDPSNPSAHSTIPNNETISNHTASSQTTTNADFLRGSGNAKSLRLMNAFVDVLRYMSLGKMICICLDDFHSADEESMELILNIVKAKIPLVFVLASRQEDKVSDYVNKVLDLEQVTKIEIHNLREKDVFEYVAATLSQNVEHALPLAAVVHEKSAGNPFLVKEILQMCYEKNCLWYDWRESGWEFDLDRVFNELTTPEQGCLTSEFVTKRLQQMPIAARSILAWASLLGNSFSFQLILKLLKGEYLYSSGHDQ